MQIHGHEQEVGLAQMAFLLPARRQFLNLGGPRPQSRAILRQSLHHLCQLGHHMGIIV